MHYVHYIYIYTDVHIFKAYYSYVSLNTIRIQVGKFIIPFYNLLFFCSSDRSVPDLHGGAHLDGCLAICGSANWLWMQGALPTNNLGFYKSQQKKFETGWVLREMKQSARWSISLKSSLSGFGTTCSKEMYLAPGWDEDSDNQHSIIFKCIQSKIEMKLLSHRCKILNEKEHYILTCYNFCQVRITVKLMNVFGSEDLCKVLVSAFQVKKCSTWNRRPATVERWSLG